MKILFFFAVVCVAVMVVMVTQVVRQEMSKNTLRALAREKAMETSKKEKAIADLKIELQGMKPKLLSLTKLTEELKANKDSAVGARKGLQDNINTCNKEKEQAEKTKAEATDNLKNLKADFEQYKNTALKTIGDLKKSNLDRENSICAAVDTTNAEARKLCGLPPL